MYILLSKCTFFILVYIPELINTKLLANILPCIFSLLLFVFILIECMRCCAILTLVT